MIKEPTITDFILNRFKINDINIINMINKKEKIRYEIKIEDKIKIENKKEIKINNKEIKINNKKVKSNKEKNNKNSYTYEFNDYLETYLRKGIKPLKHQCETLEWMKVRSKSKIKGGILALKMGLGKTSIVLFRIASKILKINNKSLNININKNVENIILNYLPKYNVGPSLVVVTKSALIVWKDEIKKFFGDKLKYLIFHRDNLKREIDTITYKDLNQYHIVFITYETLSSIAKKYNIYEDLLEKDDYNRNIGISSPIYDDKAKRKFNNYKGSKILFYNLWEDIYADESHKITNPKTIIFYTMMSLYAKYKWCLTGSPISNCSTDLFSQLKWIGGCEEIMNDKQFTYEIYMKSGLYKCIKVMNYKDAGIELKPIIEHLKLLELTTEEKQIYEYYKNATKNVYTDYLSHSNTFASVLTMFLRLRQVCICPYTVLDKSSRNNKKEKNEDYNIAKETLDKINGTSLLKWLNNKKGSAGTHSTKINEMINIIHNDIPKDEKVLVFTNFKKVIDVIIDRFYKEKITFTIFDGDVKNIDRDKHIEEFRNGNAKVFLATFKSGSESLNFSDVSNNVILLEQWYCPKTEDQAKSRVHRYGQTKNVNVWKLMIKDSIDERIEQICKEKRELAELFLCKKSSKGIRLNTELIGKILGI